MKEIIILNSSEALLMKFPWVEHLENNIANLNIDVNSIGFNVSKFSYEEWSKNMDVFMDEHGEDVGIIAHGDSASFVVRYLSENKKKVKMFISIAASSEKDVFNVSAQNKKDFSKLVKHRYSIYSNMDPICNEKELETFAIDIKASRSVVGFGEHFDTKSNIKEVPYIIDIIKEVIIKERKTHGRVVFVGKENKVGEATIKKYKEVKEYLSTKFRYVTTPLGSIEHVGAEQYKFKRYIDLIKESEFVILDVHPDSLEVGVEMMMAISMQKPTLVVAKSSIEIPDIVKCAYDEKTIKRYRNTEQLIEIIGEYIDA